MLITDWCQIFIVVHRFWSSLVVAIAFWYVQVFVPCYYRIAGCYSCSCSGKRVPMHPAGLSTENEQLSDDSAAPAHVRYSMLNGSKSDATSISEMDGSRGSGGRTESQVGPACTRQSLVSWTCSVDLHDD